MEKEKEAMEKLVAKIGEGIEAGVEMARNEPAVKELIKQAMEADEACKDREKLFTLVIHHAFALGAVVQTLEEGVKHFEKAEIKTADKE